MIEITGYQKLSYEKFRDGVQKAFKKSGKTYSEVGAAVGVASTEVIRLSFSKERQRTSDTTLSKIMKVIEYPALIIYHEGVKYYFVRK